jgi:hypothetical protein
MLEFMEKRWDISLGDAEMKVRLLGLGFILNREGKTVEGLLG